MDIIVIHLYPECLKTRLYLLLVGIHSVHVCCILKEVLFFLSRPSMKSIIRRTAFMIALFQEMRNRK